MKKKNRRNFSQVKSDKILKSKEGCMENEKLKKVNLLALLLNFEKYWSPYSLSDGSLYKEEVKVEANKLTSLFYEIYGDKSFQLTSAGEIAKPDDLTDQRLFIMSLKSWLSNNSLYPNITPQNLVVNRNRFFFQKVLSDFETQLSEELKLPVKLTCSATAYEESFHKSVLKWAAQIPDAVIPKVDEAYISNMSNYDSLVVVGDIRRSQDLMTYGSNPNVYRDKIIEFMNRTREILKSNCGLYDRFTGDGFIAYFNKYMCEQEGKDYYE